MIFIVSPRNITDNSFGGIRNKNLEFVLNHKPLLLYIKYAKRALLFNLILPDSSFGGSVSHNTAIAHGIAGGTRDLW